MKLLNDGERLQKRVKSQQQCRGALKCTFNAAFHCTPYKFVSWETSKRFTNVNIEKNFSFFPLSRLHKLFFSLEFPLKCHKPRSKNWLTFISSQKKSALLWKRHNFNIVLTSLCCFQPLKRNILRSFFISSNEMSSITPRWVLLATGIRSKETDREIQFRNDGDRRFSFQSSSVHVCVRHRRRKPFGSVILSDRAFHLPHRTDTSAEIQCKHSMKLTTAKIGRLSVLPRRTSLKASAGNPKC